MAAAREEEYTKMLDSLLDHNDRHGTSLLSKKLHEEFIIVMAEKEEEEKDAKRYFVYFYSLTRLNQYTKERCKHDKLKTNLFGHSCRNNKIIQEIYNPINNQQFCTLRFQDTG